MPGCLDHCYLYIEDHSIEHLDDAKQAIIEEELNKYERGEEYDVSLLKDVIKRRGLGDYLKDPENLPTKCRHYWEMVENLSIEGRMNILLGKVNKKWKWVATIVSIAGILVSAFFAYLNFSKPSSEELKNELSSLRKQIVKYEEEIRTKSETITKLQNELQYKKKGGQQ
jgi:hypothetical protein